ncbi:MAG TPA: hypothetical protein VGY54_24670 [Polyangiaceae bacterium]|nr:hypothetical protein [Polyangiaceae bacterium]
MRVFSLAALGIVTAACGGGGGTPTGTSMAPLLPGHNANLDGVAYPAPAAGYGRAARVGFTAGNVIQNFKFLGYPNADTSGGLQTVALADYYDPCAKRYAVIHLSVAGVWCVPCNQETDALVAAKPQLDAQRVVVIQALSDGDVLGKPAIPADLDFWTSKHKTTFTEMLDPNLHNLGGFFAASAIPWNCDIDPRTMEILDEGSGWSGDLNADLQPAITAVMSPPRYPLPVTCP